MLTSVLAVGAHAADAQRPPKGVYDVRDYGAVGDGTTLDTAAIQRAVDACAQAGGGKVCLSGGTFLSGTIRLKSNVRVAETSPTTRTTRPRSSTSIVPGSPRA